MYQSVNFSALDSGRESTRISLNATVLRVRHVGTDAGRVEVIYERGGKLFKADAARVVMASGGWINKHVLTDMPQDLRTAYEQFSYAPALIVNVALRQWRFLYDLGVTACRWFDDAEGFGYCCNLRQNMVTGGHAAPLHPDKPAVLTFYMGLPIPGLAAAPQGMAARARLLNTVVCGFRSARPAADAAPFRRCGVQARSRHCGHRAQSLGSCPFDRAARLSLRHRGQTEPSGARTIRLRPRLPSATRSSTVRSIGAPRWNTGSRPVNRRQPWPEVDIPAE